MRYNLSSAVSTVTEIDKDGDGTVDVTTAVFDEFEKVILDTETKNALNDAIAKLTTEKESVEDISKLINDIKDTLDYATSINEKGNLSGAEKVLINEVTRYVSEVLANPSSTNETISDSLAKLNTVIESASDSKEVDHLEEIMSDAALTKAVNATVVESEIKAEADKLIQAVDMLADTDPELVSTEIRKSDRFFNIVTKKAKIFTNDDDNNGTNSPNAEVTVVNELRNTGGKSLFIREDTNGDGVFDKATNIKIDPYGNTIKEEGSIVVNNDGTQTITYDVISYDGRKIDSRIDTVDSENNIVKSIEDLNKAGTPESMKIYTNKFDSKGNIIEQKIDINADAKDDNIIYKEYNQDGNVIKISHDKNADGIIDDTRTMIYNDQNRTIITELNLLNDKWIDYESIKTYDKNGAIIAYVREKGLIKSVEFTNNEFDQALDYKQIDTSKNNKVDYQGYYKYDDRQRIIEDKVDYKGDHIVDELRSYIYNENGSGYTYTVTYPKFSTKEIYIYDESGKKLQGFTENNGTVVKKTIFQYDDLDRITQESTYKGDIENPSSVKKFSYEPNSLRYTVIEIDNEKNHEIRASFDEKGLREEYSLKDLTTNKLSYKVYLEHDYTEQYKHIVEKVDYRVDDIFDEIRLFDGSKKGRNEIFVANDYNQDNVMDNLSIVRDVELSEDYIQGIKDVRLLKDDLSVTISDDVLDKIATDDNSHKVIVNSKKSGDQLHLDGNFTKTTETESHDGQNFVKYTDEAGNALIVDPDITVDII
ncbi:hypothetical protein [Phocoenobacter atlanticus]|uniref:hypothetical protein n=1 Tax=Phocoenobacter atlanticus TaxID=3416742 RepID=UPI002777DC24|nr:hypothetical protein [Pasteurella atlantica]MDP8102034.1 hypothetical protein [Pasteurella atlantica]